MVAARLLQLKVRQRCLQAGIPLTVRIFDRPAWVMSRGSWYGKKSQRTELLVVRLRSSRSTQVIEKRV